MFEYFLEHTSFDLMLEVWKDGEGLQMSRFLDFWACDLTNREMEEGVQ